MKGVCRDNLSKTFVWDLYGVIINGQKKLNDNKNLT